MYVPSWNHDGLMFSSHKNLTYVDICWPSWIQIRRWSRSTTTTQRICGSWNDFRRPRTVRADVPWAPSRPLTIRPTTKGRGAWALVAPGDTSRRMMCHRHQRIRPDHPWCLGHVCYIQKTSKIWHRYDMSIMNNMGYIYICRAFIKLGVSQLPKEWNVPFGSIWNLNLPVQEPIFEEAQVDHDISSQLSCVFF